MISLEPPAQSHSYVFATQGGPQYDDSQYLMQNFDKDSMDFSILEQGESWTFSFLITANNRSRSGRRRRRRTPATSCPISAPRRSERSTTDTRQRVADLSGRIGINTSDPALATTRNETDGFSRMTQGTNIGLAENIQHSVAVTSGLVNEVTFDRNPCREIASAIDQTTEINTVQASHAVTSPTAINGRSSRRARHRRTTSNTTTLIGARKERSKKNARIPKNVNRRRPRPTTDRIIDSNLAIIAEQARTSIECPICLYHFDEKAGRVPCTMKCGHSMCLSHAKDVGGCCPICRSSLRGQSFTKSVALCDAAAAINIILAALKLE